MKDRKRRSQNTWESFEREVERRIPNMESSYLIKFLTFYAENRENKLWSAFCDRIMVLNDFSSEEVFQILQCYHLGDRINIKIWAHMLKYYLINRSYILQYDLKQLSQIEEWYKDASKLNEETIELIKAVRAKKNPKNIMGEVPENKKTEVEQILDKTA